MLKFNLKKSQVTTVRSLESQAGKNKDKMCTQVHTYICTYIYGSFDNFRFSKHLMPYSWNPFNCHGFSLSFFFNSILNSY